MKKKIVSIFSIFLLLIALTACNPSKAQEENKDKPLVYASFYPIYDLVRQVSGDSLEVKSFMPTNVDPHMWEPTAKDMKELSKADILFVNGANMEQWVDRVEENLPNLKIVKLSNKLELISYKGASDLGDFQYMAKINGKKGEEYKFEFGHTHEDIMRVCFLRNDENLDFDKLVKKAKDFMKEKGKLTKQEETINVVDGKVYSLEMGHQSGRVYFEFDKEGEWYVVCDRVSENILPYKLMKQDDLLEIEEVLAGSTSTKDKITYDPHSWLSIKNAKAYISEINKVLSATYPENEKLYKKNSFKALDKMTTLHAQYKQKFKDLKSGNKEFVVTHYAWEYLSQEFGLVQYPLQGLVSTESPSLKTIKKAIAFCKEKNINTIFYESNIQPKSAETLAQEIGGSFVDLTSMEYLPNAENLEVGSYTKIMEENLEKLYKSMKEGE